MVAFSHLVRFQNSRGNIRHGELPTHSAWDGELVGLSVEVYLNGTVPWDDGFSLDKNKKTLVKVRIIVPKLERYERWIDGLNRS